MKVRTCGNVEEALERAIDAVASGKVSEAIIYYCDESEPTARIRREGKEVKIAVRTEGNLTITASFSPDL